MAAVINLVDTPSQAVSWVDGPTRYELRVFPLLSSMAVDLTIAGERVLTGYRVAGDTPVIPSHYLERGNLIFVTDGAEPWWSEFGVTQSLVFLTEADIADD